jgi:hypothetical protein
MPIIEFEGEVIEFPEGTPVEEIERALAVQFQELQGGEQTNAQISGDIQTDEGNQFLVTPSERDQLQQTQAQFDQAEQSQVTEPQPEQTLEQVATEQAPISQDGTTVVQRDIEGLTREQRGDKITASQMEEAGLDPNDPVMTRIADTFVSRQARIRALKEGDPTEYIWGLLTMPQRSFASLLSIGSEGGFKDPRDEETRTFFTEEINEARKEIKDLRDSGKADDNDEVRAVVREVLVSLVNDPTIVASIAGSAAKSIKSTVQEIGSGATRFGKQFPKDASVQSLRPAELAHNKEVSKILGSDIQLKQADIAKLQEFGGAQKTMDDIKFHFDVNPEKGTPVLNDGTATDFVNRFVTGKFKTKEFGEQRLVGGKTREVPIKNVEGETDVFKASKQFDELKSFENKGLRSTTGDDVSSFKSHLGNKLSESFDGIDDKAVNKLLARFHVRIKTNMSGSDIRAEISKVNRALKGDKLPVNVSDDQAELLASSMREWLDDKVVRGLQDLDKTRKTSFLQNYSDIKNITEDIQENVVSLAELVMGPNTKRFNLSAGNVSKVKDNFVKMIDEAIQGLKEGRRGPFERVQQVDRLLDMNYSDLVERAAVADNIGFFKNPTTIDAARSGTITSEGIIERSIQGQKPSPFVSGMNITLLPTPVKFANFLGRQFYENFGIGAIGKKTGKALRQIAKKNDKLKKLLKKDPEGKIPLTLDEFTNIDFKILINAFVDNKVVSATVFAKMLNNIDGSIDDIPKDVVDKNPNFFRAVDHAQKRKKDKSKRTESIEF